MKNIFIGMLLLIGAVVLPGCNGNTPDTANEQATGEATVSEAAATDSTQLLAYICPMRCEGSGSNEPGKCKVCGMDLVKNANHAAAHDSATQAAP